MEGAAQMYRNSPPELKSGVRPILRDALLSAVQTCNRAIAPADDANLSSQSIPQIEKSSSVDDDDDSTYITLTPSEVSSNYEEMLQAAKFRTIEQEKKELDQITKEYTESTSSPALNDEGAIAKDRTKEQEKKEIEQITKEFTDEIDAPKFRTKEQEKKEFDQITKEYTESASPPDSIEEIDVPTSSSKYEQMLQIAKSRTKEEEQEELDEITKASVETTSTPVALEEDVPPTSSKYEEMLQIAKSRTITEGKENIEETAETVADESLPLVDNNSEVLMRIMDDLQQASGDGKMGIKSDLTSEEASDMINSIGDMRNVLMEELDSGIPEPPQAPEPSAEPSSSKTANSKYLEMLALAKARKDAK